VLNVLRLKELSASGKYFPFYYELYPHLGIDPKRHLPVSDRPQRFSVRGCLIVIEPSSGKGRRSPHRVKVECDKCRRMIPFGRLGQHVKRRDHQS
jgi:hypothetical protein